MKKRILESGIEVITYSPPGGFDPLAASAAERKKYGFPSYPDHPVARRHYRRVWRALRTKLQYIKPVFRVQHDVVYGLPNVLATLRAVTSNWSGAIVNTDQLRPFHFCAAGFVVPDIQAPTIGKRYHAGIWLGLDSAPQRQVLQGGVGCNVLRTASSSTSEFFVWFEWFPGPSVRVVNFPVKVGDHIEVILCASPLAEKAPHVTAGTITYINRTTGVSTAVTVMAPDGVVLFGETAEWIVEAPTVATGQAELPNYGHVTFRGYAVTGERLLGAGTGDTFALQGPTGNIVSDCKLLNVGMVRCDYVAT